MIQHVAIELREEHADACVRFWVLLGFEQVTPPPALAQRTAWVQRAGTQVHLLFAEDPVIPSLGHVAVLVEDYDATLSALREAGFEPQPRTEHWGCTALLRPLPGGASRRGDGVRAVEICWQRAGHATFVTISRSNGCYRQTEHVSAGCSFRSLPYAVVQPESADVQVGTQPSQRPLHPPRPARTPHASQEPRCQPSAPKTRPTAARQVRARSHPPSARSRVRAGIRRSPGPAHLR